MPFFFIAPIWLLCVRRPCDAHFEPAPLSASYLILCSTFGLIVSFLVSTASLLLLAKLMAIMGSDGSIGGIVTILGYLVGIVAGAAAGIVVGANDRPPIESLGRTEYPNLTH